MIKSGNLLIALAAIVIAAVAMLKTNMDIGEIAPLQNYSDGARHWSTINYYRDNQGGYQASAAAWSREAFH